MMSVRATPTPVNETQFTNSWFPEPDTRGTSNVLYSCIFTLSICVYSAIHLNIPPRGESEKIQGWRKTKWVLIAIFAPEVVLYTSWYQYYLAKSFCQEMYSLRLRQEGIQPIVKESKWQELYSKPSWRPKDKLSTTEKVSTTADPTHAPPPCALAYGFYVVMGGLTVDTSDIHDTISSITLTPGGVLRLAERSSWKYFTVAETAIHDKSKADNLAKLLIFLQVSWTVLQCISRKASGLPLAILEVHTLVHAGCAMVMYAFWFRKPLDIRDSTLLDVSKFANEFALEFLRSPIPFDSHFNRIPRPQNYLSEAPYQNKPRMDTEAAYLMFDMSRLDAALESGGAETPNVVSILDSATRMSNGHQMLAVSSDTTRGSPSLDCRSRGVANRDLDHQVSVAKAGIYRPVTPNVEAEQIVWTGQTLSSGVGPAARLTGKSDGIIRDRLMVIAERLFRGRLGPVDTVILSPELKAILTLPENPENFECHQITFSLSKKDIRRWHRAAAAFAHTILVEGATDSATNDGPDQAQHQNSFEPGAEAVQNINTTKVITHRDTRLERQATSSNIRHDVTFMSETTEDPDTSQVAKESNSRESRLDWSQAFTAGVTAGFGAGEGRGDRAMEKQEQEKPTGIEGKTAEDQKERLRSMYRPPSWDVHMFREAACKVRSTNFDAEDLAKAWRGPARGTAGLTSSLALAVIASLYAGVHLALWMYTFPSALESLLWKIASCTLGVPSVFFILITGFGIGSFLAAFGLILLIGCISVVWQRLTPNQRSHESVDSDESGSSDHGKVRPEDILDEGLNVIAMITSPCYDFVNFAKQPDKLPRLRDLGSTAPRLHSLFARGTVKTATAVSCTLYYGLWGLFLVAIIGFCGFMLLLIPGVLLYILSRIYIVVESFVSLRSVPTGVYQGVTWAQYIPHF